MSLFTLKLDRARRELIATRHDTARFLGPKRGIVIIGRVDRSLKGAREIARYGSNVAVCYVNPRPGEIDGAIIYPSVADVPDGFDVALVRVPAAQVEQVVADCAARGIRDVVVFSAGFAESGEVGERLERDLASSARRLGVRLIGPNTTDNMFERFPLPAGHPGKGKIGIITQSGANGRALVEGISMGACIHRWVTLGNEADLELADMVDYFARDPEVTVISAYVEGFKSPEKLRFALEEANRNDTPVVMLKIGASSSGARMAASHTGHLSGWDAIVQGLLDQYGVTRVCDLDELLETSNLFAKLDKAPCKRATLYSFSGGTATLMAEVAEKCGLAITPLTDATQAKLANYLPANVAKANPVDNGGLFTFEASQEDRIAVLDLLLNDPNTDVLVIGFNAAFGMLSDTMAADLLQWARSAGKPVLAVWSSVSTEGAGYADLVASAIPVFRSITGCFTALAACARYDERRKHFRTRTVESGVFPSLAFDLMAETDSILPGCETRALLAAYGIPFLREQTVACPSQAREAADGLGYPVALKIASVDFPHKTDFGLVKLNVTCGEEVASESRELLKTAKWSKSRARIDGVTVQEMAGKGVEVLVGLSRDPVMGPALTIGAGGIYTEFLEDVAVRPLPVDEADIREMIRSLRIYKLLRCARGMPPVDIDGLVSLACAVARLGMEADALQELDLNPVVVELHRTVVADALAVVGPA